jgi:hypothetical protein
MRYVVGFLQFWYDFIVGDSILLAIGGVGVLLLGYLLAEANAAVAAEVLMPAGIIGTIWASVHGMKS